MVRVALVVIVVIVLALAWWVITNRGASQSGVASATQNGLPRLAYYSSEIGRYSLWVSVSDDSPVEWARARAATSAAVELEDGRSVALVDVSAYAVTYPSGMVVDIMPETARPFPPGATFPEDVRPRESYSLRVADVQPGRLRVPVSFGRSGGHPEDARYYTTTLHNAGEEAVRVVRFGGFADRGTTYELSTITGGFFPAAYFRDWYAVPDPDGWLQAGESVSDPNNYGGLDSLWAYEIETASGERFWTGGRP